MSHPSVPPPRPSGGGPTKAPPRNPLGQPPHPLAAGPQPLDQPATLAAEHEQVPTVRVALQHLLHQQRQAVEATAHVRHTARQPYPRLRRQPDHRPNARNTRPSADSSTAASTRTRTSPPSSISIEPSIFGRAAHVTATARNFNPSPPFTPRPPCTRQS